MVEDLIQGGGPYRKVWHLTRLRGALAWTDSVTAWERGAFEEQRLHAGAAARWYSAAIRSRPKFRFFFRAGSNLIPVVRFPVPPILYANARDAHEVAGHRWRTHWYELRFQRVRMRLYKRGYKEFVKGNWHAASDRLDWASRVGRRDPTEVGAATILAVTLKQLRADQEAEEVWEAVFSFDPVTSLAFRSAVAQEHDLPQGVPGEQPTDPEAVSKLTAKIVEQAGADGSLDEHS
jgi:hypothetical protein